MLRIRRTSFGLNALHRTVEVLMLGPCGPFLVRNVRRVMRFVRAVHSLDPLRARCIDSSETQFAFPEQVWYF